MSYVATQNPNIIRQEVYDAALVKSLDDWLVGRPLFDDKTGIFGDGDTLKITKTGDRALSNYTEDTGVDFSKMATSRVELAVTDYKQDGWYMTDKQKQDGHQAMAFFAENVRKSAIAFERDIEQAVFKVANQQTLGAPNLINGQPHRFAGSGTSGNIALQDIANLKLSFDLALVPVENRVLVINPQQEFELNKLLNIVEVANGSTFNNNFDGLVQTGFGDRLNFVRNIYGFNIMISHNLPAITAETIVKADGTGSATYTGQAMIAMSMASSDDMPFMGVMRQRPASEFYRNVTMKRDEYSTTCRYGFALKRAETLGVIVTPT
jgi:hypothetical protein